MVNGQFFCIFARKTKIRLPKWWNGRHEGLKIPWPLRLCGFESHFRYQEQRRCVKERHIFFFILQTKQHLWFPSFSSPFPLFWLYFLDRGSCEVHARYMRGTCEVHARYMRGTLSLINYKLSTLNSQLYLIDN